MKRSLVIAFIALFTAFGMNAQKYCAVDTKYILEHMQEYIDAQEELDRVSGEWQEEIEVKYATIERLVAAYQAEAVLLTEEMKRSREEEIEKQKQDARMLQQQRFGVEGDLFKKRQQLIQPVQQQIFDAIREYASEGGYMFVFDKAAGKSNVLYANVKYDKSDKILRKLGLRPGDKPGQGDDKKEEKSSTESKTEDRSTDGGGDRGGNNSIERRK
ncbi:MAG: OmpH family outer membrane protein [Flavobacteriales bacterium]|nr:OmpH family outer membrane protein [Flavobacteriales bacterium]